MTKTLTAFGLAALCGSSLAFAGHGHGHKGLAALEQSKISAAQAIATAEKDTGATADSIDLKLKRDAVIYEIELFDSAQEYEIRIDATSGEIFSRKSGQKANPPAKSAVSLSQAIETAEGQGKGKVVEADLEGRRDGSVVYETKATAKCCAAKLVPTNTASTANARLPMPRRHNLLTQARPFRPHNKR